MITSLQVCLFGPQGSGKGTQAEKLSEYFGIPHIAPGNIFRKAVADATDLGHQVESIVREGHLVPNELTNALMKERVSQEDVREGFVLDGYPRNAVQADALDAMTPLTHVIIIDIPDEESVRRISQRRSCPSCGAPYHLSFKPPKDPSRCDSCGSELVLRDDDRPEAIRQRLAIYHSDTEPLFERYAKRDILHHIDGMGPIDTVWQRVLSIVE